VSQPDRQPRSRTALQQRVIAAILEAAAGVLAQRGAQANMTDVSHAAGLARATVYRYFPSRQALLDELMSVALDDADERLAAAGLHGVPLDEGVRRAVRALLEVGDAFVVLAHERGPAHAADFDARIAVPLARLLDDARSSDEVRDDVPTPWLVEALVALVVALPRMPPARAREDTIAAITSLFLSGAARAS
jgi:TetR/AcrR family transcriptional regulator, mexCD-oprJ operon repressor